MKVIATFIGEDGSLGYEHGKEYEIEVRGFEIRRGPDDGGCRYGSIHAFLANWTGIRHPV